MANDFGSYSRRDEASISRYMSFIATKNTGQKTSKMGELFFSKFLIPLRNVDPCSFSGLFYLNEKILFEK